MLPILIASPWTRFEIHSVHQARHEPQNLCCPRTAWPADKRVPLIGQCVQVVPYQRSIHSRQRATEPRSKALVCWKQISMKIFSSTGFWFLDRPYKMSHRRRCDFQALSDKSFCSMTRQNSRAQGLSAYRSTCAVHSSTRLRGRTPPHTNATRVGGRGVCA